MGFAVEPGRAHPRPTQAFLGPDGSGRAPEVSVTAPETVICSLAGG